MTTTFSVPRWNDPRGFVATEVDSSADWVWDELRAPCGCECRARRWRHHLGGLPITQYSSGTTWACDAHSRDDDEHSWDEE